MSKISDERFFSPQPTSMYVIGIISRLLLCLKTVCTWRCQTNQFSLSLSVSLSLSLSLSLCLSLSLSVSLCLSLSLSVSLCLSLAISFSVSLPPLSRPSLCLSLSSVSVTTPLRATTRLSDLTCSSQRTLPRLFSRFTLPKSTKVHKLQFRKPERNVPRAPVYSDSLRVHQMR